MKSAADRDGRRLLTLSRNVDPSVRPDRTTATRRLLVVECLCLEQEGFEPVIQFCFDS